MDEKITKLYEMPIHARTDAGKYTEIVRVPGGWIYNMFTGDWSSISSVFVPFNNEFQVNLYSQEKKQSNC